MRFIAALLLVSSLCTTAQETSLVDSLKRELPNSSDSIKQILYLDLSWEYSFSNIDTSEYYGVLGVELAKKRENETSLAIAKSMLAIVYDIQGKTEDAAALYIEVAKFYEEENNLEELSKAYNNLGVLFFYSDNLEKSWDYYLKSMEIDEKLGNDIGVAESLINLAAISNKWDKNDEALKYLLRGQEIAERYPENNWIRRAIYEGLANCYNYRESYDSSLFYYHAALPIFAAEQDIRGTLSCYNGIIAGYYNLDEYDSAILFLDKAEKLSHEIEDIIIRKKRNELAASLYAAIGDHEKAYDYQEAFIVDNDSTNNLERLRITGDLEEKYQAEQRENEISKLQIAQQQSENQRNILMLVAALVVLAAVFLFMLVKSKSKSNKVIAKSLAEKETLLKEIHHRVKNNLQVVSSLLSMQSRFIKDEEAIGAVSEGQSRVESMALIHQKLYQENNLSGVKAKEYIEDLAEILRQSYSINENVEFEYMVDDLTIDVDTIIPIGLILNELICNSLKYAFPEGKDGCVKIRLEEKQDQLQLEVSDDGIGSNGQSSDKSFGMVLIESLAMKLKASLQTSAEGGTSTILNIQKYKLI